MNLHHSSLRGDLRFENRNAIGRFRS
uniref:Uncharacterized protein n=1 Tax=Arundo donax TaxID=35708 RepID=A0A0A9C1S5_ARUDO